MNYKIVNINTSGPKTPKASILIIYTGGTFGMSYNNTGTLVPFNFGKAIEKIPTLRTFELKLTVISFPQPADSSDISIQHWSDMAYIIHENYAQYDGFVILHGTDTMAHSASALSFMLEGLNKPVIFTGAQIPLGATRSDARENLITALEIASAKEGGQPLVPEVCIYFNYLLLRGNRAKKVQSLHFAAFESENYPNLAEAGIIIDYNKNFIKPYDPKAELTVCKEMNNKINILKLFPSITPEAVKAILTTPGMEGLILETYGSGNSITNAWFMEAIEKAVKKGLIILNVSQCNGGRVIMGKYESSKMLADIGVLSGSDITTEAAVTKMMYLLANENDKEKVKAKLTQPIRGEMA